MNNSIQVPYGLRLGRLYCVTEVESGLSCDCVCPFCKNPLIARKGQKNEHHFAHHDAEPCKYARESALHLMAKQILLDHQQIWLPSLWTDVEDHLGDSLEVLEDGIYNLENIVAESRLHSIVPDIFASRDGREMIIEIYVTHKVSSAKLSKIQEMEIDCLEINLSVFRNYNKIEKLKELIIGKAANKKWLYSKTKVETDLRLEKEEQEREAVPPYKKNKHHRSRYY